MFLLVFVAVVGFSTPSIRSNAAQASSCPTSQVFRYILAPIPTGFNLLSSAPVTTVFEVGSGIMSLSLTPFPLMANGSLDWSDSITNSITSNSNYSQWVFHIKPGLKWSDGTYITANDIINWASPAYALNPAYDFPGLHTEIVKEIAVNSSTVQFNLNVSDAHFPEKISSYYYGPPLAPSMVAKGVADNLFTNDVVSGPYYPVNYTSGSTTLIMARNQYYTPAPVPCELEIHFVEGSSYMTQFLVSGQADLAGPVAFGDIPTLQTLPNIHLNVYNGSIGDWMSYNVTEYPYNMTQFRQALAYAINYSSIVQDAYFGYGVSAAHAQGEVSPAFNTYSPNQPTYNYNVAKALDLLHSIGFTGGGNAGALKYPNGTAFSTTIWTTIDSSWSIDEANIVAQDLSILGMQLSVETGHTSNLIGDWFANAFNIRNDILVYGSPSAFYGDTWLDGTPQCNVISAFGCTPGYFSNHWQYPPSADIPYQSNLSALTATANPAQAQVYLNNIQNMSATNLPWITLGYPDLVVAYNTQRWTNWPTSPNVIQFATAAFNKTLFSTIQPVTTTSTSTTAQTSTTVITSTISGSVSTITSTTTSTTSKSSVAMNWSILGVVLAIVLVAGAMLIVRRPNSDKKLAR